MPTDDSVLLFNSPKDKNFSQPFREKVWGLIQQVQTNPAVTI